MLHSRQEMQDVDDARMCAVDENTLIARARGARADLLDWDLEQHRLGRWGKASGEQPKGSDLGTSVVDISETPSLWLLTSRSSSMPKAACSRCRLGGSQASHPALDCKTAAATRPRRPGTSRCGLTRASARSAPPAPAPSTRWRRRRGSSWP